MTEPAKNTPPPSVETTHNYASPNDRAKKMSRRASNDPNITTDPDETNENTIVGPSTVQTLPTSFDTAHHWFAFKNDDDDEPMFVVDNPMLIPTPPRTTLPGRTTLESDSEDEKDSPLSP
jgi:hypothetical protein